MAALTSTLPSAQRFSLTCLTAAVGFWFVVTVAGQLLFAFTVFSAYIHFSQYFIIWNANMPEETWWYVWREKGTWFAVGVVLIFGHFLVPFLSLLRIDVKLVFKLMLPLCLWIGAGFLILVGMRLL